MLNPKHLLLLAGLVIASAASAQTWENRHDINMPSGLGDGTYHEIVPIDMFDDGRTSVAIRVNDTLICAYNPEALASISLIDTLVKSVAALPEDGDADRVIYATENDMIMAEVDATPTFAKTSILSSAWWNAAELHTRLEPGTTTHAIAALTSDRQTILTASATNGGTPVAISAISLGSTIDELELVDWDEDGSLEVVAFSMGNITAHELNSTPVSSDPQLGVDPVATVLENDPNGQRLVYVSRDPISGEHWLHSRNQTEIDASVQVDMSSFTGPVTVRGLVSGDMEGDGDEDLLLTQDTSHEVMVLANPFGGNVSIVNPLGAGSSSTKADPAWVDVDHDGLLDLIIGDRTAENLTVAFGMDGSLTSQLVVVQWLDDEADFDTQIVSVRIPVGLVGDYTDIEIICWHQDDPIDVTPAPLLDLDAVFHLGWVVSQMTPVNGLYQLDLPFPNNGSYYFPEKDHYYLEMRLYDEVVDGYSQTYTAGLTMKPNIEAPNSAIWIYFDTLSGGGGEDEKILTKKKGRSLIVGGIITAKNLPDHDGSGLPDPGPINY